MADPFAALDRIASEAVEGAFGVGISIRPRLPGSQYVAAESDPDRPEMQAKAIFSSGPAIEDIGGQGRSGASGGTTKIAGQTLVLWLSPSAVASIPYTIRKGDAVAFADKPHVSYEIVVARPTNTGDLELTITKE